MNYSVVEFTDGFEVVCSKWLVKTDGQLFCAWPNEESYDEYIKMLKARPDADSSWRENIVLQVLGKYDTLQCALVKSKEAEQFTDINSETDGGTKKKRRRRPNPKFQSSGDEVPEEKRRKKHIKKKRNKEAPSTPSQDQLGSPPSPPRDLAQSASGSKPRPNKLKQSKIHLFKDSNNLNGTVLTFTHNSDERTERNRTILSENNGNISVNDPIVGQPKTHAPPVTENGNILVKDPVVVQPKAKTLPLTENARTDKDPVVIENDGRNKENVSIQRSHVKTPSVVPEEEPPKKVSEGPVNEENEPHSGPQARLDLVRKLTSDEKTFRTFVVNELLNLKSKRSCQNVECHPNVSQQTAPIPKPVVEKMTAIKELADLDAKLKNDAAFFRKFVNEISLVGGKNVDKICKAILPRIMTATLGSLYSWQGGKGKEKFNELPSLLKALRQGIRNTYHNKVQVAKEASDTEIEVAIKDWLRQCIGISKRAASKRTKPKTTEETPNNPKNGETPSDNERDSESGNDASLSSAGSDQSISEYSSGDSSESESETSPLLDRRPTRRIVDSEYDSYDEDATQ